MITRSNYGYRPVFRQIGNRRLTITKSAQTLTRRFVRQATKNLQKGKGKSRTNTRTKPKLFQQVKLDGPMSSSYYRWPQAKSSFKLGKMAKLLAPQHYVTNTTGRLGSGVGLQNYTNTTTSGIPGLWTIVDLDAIHTQAVLPAPSTTNPVTQKVYLKDVKSELMITNQTNDPAHLTLYECIARRDISDADVSNPGNAWLQSDTDLGGTAFSKMVGSTPFQGPPVVAFWKIQKVINVTLASGGHHIHRSKSVVNHMLSAEIMDNLPSTNAALGLLTRFTLVVVHGYPVNDSVTSTQISTANVAIDMIWRKEYTFQICERSTTVITAGNTLPTSFTNASSIITDAYAVAAATVQA